MSTRAPSPSEHPATTSDPGLMDDELAQLGHQAAPQPDTIETTSGERVPEPDEDGTVAESHIETADRLDHSGADH